MSSSANCVKKSCGTFLSKFPGTSIIINIGFSCFNSTKFDLKTSSRKIWFSKELSAFIKRRNKTQNSKVRFKRNIHAFKQEFKEVAKLLQ